jgi:ribose 5-phosphate isomerase A
MLLGLGTGSTAEFVTRGVGARLRDGRLEDVHAVPTSEATRALAEALGIPLVDLPADGVDLAIDGMDEVTPALDAIKGLGGALLREKIVAASANRFVLIGDDRKPVARLGERAPVPVELLPFGYRRTVARLGALDVRPTLRLDGGRPFVTDNGNWIVDCAFAPERDAHELARGIEAVPGVLGHGFFFGLATLALIAGEDGVRAMNPRSDG